MRNLLLIRSENLWKVRQYIASCGFDSFLVEEHSEVKLPVAYTGLIIHPMVFHMAVFRLQNIQAITDAWIPGYSNFLGKETLGPDLLISSGISKQVPNAK